MCLLAKDPAQRPKDATALASAVDAIRRRDLKAAVKAVPSLAQFLAEENADDATVAMTAMDVAAEPISASAAPFWFWWSFLAGADDGAYSSNE